MPRRAHAFGPRLQARRAGQPSGGDDDHVGGVGQDRVDIGDDVVPKIDAELGELGEAPVDDAHQVLATRVPCGQPHLPARPRHRLEDDDLVAPFGADAGGLRPTGSGADDDDAPPRRGQRDRVRHRALTTGGRVVDAHRRAALVDAVEAVGGADAWADPCLLPGGDLGDEVGIGEVRPGHPDEVDEALADGVPSGGHIVDLGRVEHGEPGGRPHPTREVEVRGRRHAVDRDDAQQRRSSAMSPRITLTKSIRPSDSKRPRISSPVAASIPPGRVSSMAIRMPTMTSDPTCPRMARSTRSGNRSRFSKAPAVVVGPHVRQRGPELIEEVAVCLDLDAVRPAGDASVPRRPRSHPRCGRGPMPPPAWGSRGPPAPAAATGPGPAASRPAPSRCADRGG